MNEPKNMENKLNSHRASADQWAVTEKWAKDCTYESCLIELRNRLEALERKAAINELRAASAEARPAPFDEAENDRRFDQASSLLEQPDKLDRLIAQDRAASSLVERVMIAGGMGLTESARAAIREVAVAARSRGDQPFTWEHVAQWLEQEADRD